jgi:hypothetical protein
VCAGLAALTLRIDVRFVAARLAVSVLVDVVWTVLRGRRLGASPDATAIAFATLIAFHVVAFGGPGWEVGDGRGVLGTGVQFRWGALGKPIMALRAPVAGRGFDNREGCGSHSQNHGSRVACLLHAR